MKITVKNTSEQPFKPEPELILIPVPAGFGCEALLVGETPVTEAQWADVLGGEIENGPNYPKANLNVDDCKEFCERLGERSDYRFRLPSEVEQARLLGLEPEDLEKYAVFGQNEITEVKTKLPNEYGLYDVRGLIWEWTEPQDGYSRLRGGSWFGYRVVARAVARLNCLPAYRDGLAGFRVVVARPK